MDTKKVSVIIPVYNVEEYLPDCLESIIKQSYKNLEIILIDDGSTDNSGIICDQYATEYQNIIVVHQKNQGVSSARNHGMTLASGEYISFVDPDDLLDCNTYAIMLPLMQDNNVDISFFEFLWFDEAIPANMPALSNIDKIHVLKEEKRINIPLRYSGSSCNCIYSTQLIAGQKFSEHYKLSEDTLFLVEALLKSRAILFLKQKLYFRRRNQSSATRAKYNSEWIKVFDVLDIITSMLMKNNPIYKNTASYIFYTKTYEIIHKLDYEYSSNSQDISLIQSYVKKNFSDIIRNPYISKKGKLAFFLFCVSPIFFYKLVSFYRLFQ